MRVSFSVAFVSAAFLVGFVACGGSVKSSGGAPELSDDAGSDVPAEAGVPFCNGGPLCMPDASAPPPPTPVDSNYPTSHSPIPPVTYNGGNILDTPKIVTVTFDGDALRDVVEAFDDVITTTPWWTAVASEYCDTRPLCIGQGTSGGHVHVTASPATNYDDTSQNTSSGLKIYIDQQIQSGLFPAPDAETLYVLYFPETTKISLDGSASCDTFGGYHNAMQSTPPGMTAPVTFAYAVLPRCSGSKSDLTFAASHEVVESATDPFISPDGQSYYAFGSTSDAWDIVGGGEVGDRCVDYSGQGQDSYQESGYTVQRTWSNKAAAASHDPCVPAPAVTDQPYFNMAPGGGDILTMTVGQTVTAELTAFSDGPLDPFTVEASETSEFLGLSDVLVLTLDQTTMQNGQVAHLTVNLQSPPTQGTATFVVTSTSGNISHDWSFIVQTM